MNNEQVIKYVSENSKNPHAAMIVEWLLTGWGIEFKSSDGSWVAALSPIWSAKSEYRLVKPKRKPAYRVYKHKDTRGSFVQDRYEDGTLSYYVDEDQITILQDWTEYDPEPKQWPTPLVERIAAIDIKAAEWIVEHWDELLECKYTHNGRYSRESDQLRMMFSWIDAPQGGYYWLEIYKKLGE